LRNGLAHAHSHSGPDCHPVAVSDRVGGLVRVGVNVSVNVSVSVSVSAL
jgi:hypothetical protein